MSHRDGGTDFPPSPYPPNWPDCNPDDPTPPPTTEELTGDGGTAIPRLTYCSWGPIQHVTVSATGVPPGHGTVRAVRRYPEVLRRLGNA